LALGAAALWKLGVGRSGGGVPDSPDAVAIIEPELPRGLVDPRELRRPAGLSPNQEVSARQALDAHGQALDALRRQDAGGFMRLANEALRSYQEAGWLPDELGSFHHEFLASQFQSGNVQAVERAAKAWLDRHPDSLLHHEILGIARYRQGRYAEAAPHFERIAAALPGSIKTWRRLASNAAAHGAKDRAIEALDRMLALIGFPERIPWRHPEVEPTMRAALMVAHRFYDYARLERIASVFTSRFPADAEGLMALGVAKRYAGDHAGAERALRATLGKVEASPENAELIRFELGVAILKQGRAREALEELAQLLLASPHFTRGYYQAGLCLARLGKAALAEGFTTLSRDLAPGEREFRREIELRGIGQPALALRHRARAFALVGDFSSGEAVLRGIASPGPAELVHLIEYLTEILKIEEAREAIRRLEEKLGPASSDVRGWKARGRILAGEARDGARELAALCVEPGLLPIWGMPLARACLDEVGDPAQAARVLERLLAAGPDTLAKVLRGRALVESGETAAALELLSAIPPQEDEWHDEAGALWLSLCRIRSGKDLEKAREDLFEAREPPLWRPEWHLARAEWLEASSAADPAAAAQAKEARAEAARLNERRTKAQELRARAARSPAAERAALLLESARTLQAMGDRRGAILTARLAAASDPKSKTAHETLAAMLDRPEEAFLRAAELRRLKAIDPAAAEPPDVAAIVRLLLGDP
jgi:hypothetical protein